MVCRWMTTFLCVKCLIPCTEFGVTAAGTNSPLPTVVIGENAAFVMSDQAAVSADVDEKEYIDKIFKESIAVLERVQKLEK